MVHLCTFSTLRQHTRTVGQVDANCADPLQQTQLMNLAQLMQLLSLAPLLPPLLTTGHSFCCSQYSFVFFLSFSFRVGDKLEEVNAKYGKGAKTLQYAKSMVHRAHKGRELLKVFCQ